MDSSCTKEKRDEILIDASPIIRLYKSGRVKRLPLLDPPPVPPSMDPITGVLSKDIKISIKTGVKVRIYNPDPYPSNSNYQTKIPILLYFHGGGFCLESTFSKKYHNYLNQLAYKAGVMIVSVEYRRAPEHRLPAAYDDCWDALKWVLSYNDNNGDCSNNTRILSEQEEEGGGWIRNQVDFSRIFLMGDSSGGNIAHHVALRLGIQGLGKLQRLEGIILVHPFFWGKQRIGNEVAKCIRLHIPDLSDKMWALASPIGSCGVDDPWINPAKDPNLPKLGCKRVLVSIAEKDSLSDRGVYYKETLEKSGWKGSVELLQSNGEDHVFHLLHPSSTNSVDLMTKVVAFLNPNTPSRL